MKRRTKPNRCSEPILVAKPEPVIRNARKVFCKWCGHLVKLNNAEASLCVSRAQWVGNAIVRRVDVCGVTCAARSNAANDCSEFVLLFSFNTFMIKRWVKKRIQEKMNATKK